jgi:hypothetical protein
VSNQTKGYQCSNKDNQQVAVRVWVAVWEVITHRIYPALYAAKRTSHGPVKPRSVSIAPVPILTADGAAIGLGPRLAGGATIPKCLFKRFSPLFFVLCAVLGLVIYNQSLVPFRAFGEVVDALFILSYKNMPN